jgi:hypothetical protein
MESGLRTCTFLLAAMLLAPQGSFAADGSTARATANVGKPIAPRNLLGRWTFSSSASERAGPNAIGVLVRHHGGVPGPDSGPGGVGSSLRVPAVAGGGQSAAGLAKSGGALANPRYPGVHPTPTVNSIAPNRPVINGTSLVRHGSGPPGIGGPAKTIAGISGTAIRHKH